MKKIVLSLIIGLSLFGASLQTCVKCHGVSFEKMALGKSKIVKDLTEEEIEISLKGYKDGTYGGIMKGVMKS